jgi:hypothetical protein
MQNWQRKCIVTWPAVLNSLNIKFDFTSADVLILIFCHQKYCENNKNMKSSF